ncbi:MAG: type IV pilin N-terminal domain-containing protein [Candidatus Thermoplasmatota archaeon]
MRPLRNLKNREDAVSAVIGVILMVAITVAIAATVYVYVSGMIGTGTQQTENAGVQVTGTNKQIKLLLSKGGANAPYANETGDTGYDVFINGTKLGHGNFSCGEWETGESIILDGTVGGHTINAGVEYAITVQILGSTVYDSYVTVTN